MDKALDLFLEGQGHRQRLRTRFIQGGADALADHELLELLLTFAIPRKDMKPMAKTLINHYGSLGQIFNQSYDSLLETSGLGPNAVVLVMLIRQLMIRVLEAKYNPGKKISSPSDVADFIRFMIGQQLKECVMLLCLNASNRLIHQSVISEGTVNQASIFPREVAQIALRCGATAVILVHNHPGGICRPSPEDIEMTKRIKEALQPLDIILHDHLIVTSEQVYSIAADCPIT